MVSMGKALPELYEADFYRWTVRNAELLRSGRLADADVANIAQEIRDRGISQRRELISRSSVLLRHLLMYEFSRAPLKASTAKTWTATIRWQRRELARLLEQMPSLRHFLTRDLPKIYREAAEDAVFEGRLDATRLPGTCPYAEDRITTDVAVSLPLVRSKLVKNWEKTRAAAPSSVESRACREGKMCTPVR